MKESQVTGRGDPGNQLLSWITRTQLDRERITPDGDGWSKGRGIRNRMIGETRRSPQTSHCSKFQSKKARDRRKEQGRETLYASHLKSKN